MTMNKHIKKVNSHLWLVNFDYIDAGYIPELKDAPQHDGYNLSTENGVIIFNSKNEDAEGIAKLFDFVMNLANKHLEKGVAFKQYIAKAHNPNILVWDDEIVEMYVTAGDFEEIRNMFNRLSTIERTRRKVIKQYNRKHPLKALVGWLKHE